ncbi:hypothetical protein HMPREF1551_01294 [Capnocytophaga sp. oral taxon 863 str. F0517]|nr:hypothetical protein HMPREF1551_01294 [Capnocytophaga sp. oral taxon 863 str. F0517]
MATQQPLYCLYNSYIRPIYIISVYRVAIGDCLFIICYISLR